MRTQLTVIKVGESEVLSGGATKLKFTAKDGREEVACFTFKTNIISEVQPGAILDVDVDELHFTAKGGNDILAYKVWALHKEGESTNGKQLSQPGTWREEKAAECITALLVGQVIKSKHKLAKKLFTWLEDSMPE